MYNKLSNIMPICACMSITLYYRIKDFYSQQYKQLPKQPQKHHKPLINK